MDFPTDPHAWIAFATLALLELVLGIDNVVSVFIEMLNLRLRKTQTAPVGLHEQYEDGAARR